MHFSNNDSNTKRGTDRVGGFSLKDTATMEVTLFNFLYDSSNTLLML